MKSFRLRRRRRLAQRAADDRRRGRLHGVAPVCVSSPSRRGAVSEVVLAGLASLHGRSARSGARRRYAICCSGATCAHISTHRLNVSVVEGTAKLKYKGSHPRLSNLRKPTGGRYSRRSLLYWSEVRSGHVKVPSTLDPSTVAGPVPRARPVADRAGRKDEIDAICITIRMDITNKT